MSFFEAIKSYFKNYARFNGRARRSEYWFSVLFSLLVQAPVNVAVSITSPESDLTEGYFLIYLFAAIVATILLIGLVAPALAVTVRRLHDTGRSAWYFMWGFLPLVGAIIFLVALLEDSSPSANKYGEPVK
jgi:uncharacterized membrane protein YhaH (DUF805 family)